MPEQTGEREELLEALDEERARRRELATRILLFARSVPAYCLLIVP